MCYCTVIALFYFEFEGNFQVQAPGGLYLEGRFNGGIFRYEFRGPVYRLSRDIRYLVIHLRRFIFGGAYTWRGLFSKFYGI